MVKKLQKMAEKKAASPAGLLDGDLAQTIKDSAQQIWLAGLGAFAKAQGEGTKVFDTLIKEGSSLHRRTQSVAEGKLGDVAGKVTALAGEVGNKANAQWDKLESIFEERTAKALAKLGVPTARDVAALQAQVSALQAQLTKLGGKPATKARPVAAPAPQAAAAPRKRAPKAVAAAPVKTATAKKTARKTARA